MFAYSGRTAVTTIAILVVVNISTVASARAEIGVHSETEQQLLACDVIIDLTDKLTCFNAIVENLKENLTAADTTYADRGPAAGPMVAPAASGTAAQQPEARASRQTVAEAVPTAAATVDVDEFGRESVKIESDAKEKDGEKNGVESIQATIVGVWKTSDQRFAVELDNGQIWRETSASRIAMPKKGRSVEISKGRFGSYRMKVERIKRLAYVRREK